MQHWIQAFINVVDSLLKHPGTALETWVLIGSGVAFFMWVYARMGNALGVPRPGGFRAVFTAILGLALVLAACTTVNLYMPGATFWLVIVVPLIMALIIVLPLTRLIQRTGYFTAFFIWLISGAALAAIVLLIGAGFDAFNSGRERVDKTKVHNRDLEYFIGK